MTQSSVNAKTDQLDALLNRLYDLHPKLIDLSLDRMHRILKDLGNPHHKLPPVIHVAGTNGKGSTIAALRAILEAHGKSCHVATSPHLKRINERIVLAGTEISDNRLSDLIEECIDVNAGQDITFFEMMMAVTFLAFSRVEADYCLLETGLGGRYDASNVVHDPITCIITAISLDHKDFLGDTYTAIAGEKAGIMKHSVPCIVGKQSDVAIANGVINTFQSYALSTNSVLHTYGSEWVAKEADNGFTYQDSKIKYTLPLPSLLGRHQIYNCGAAIAALRVIDDFEIDPKKLSKALGQINWPARLQSIDTPRTQILISNKFSVWLDGGHNDGAGAAIADQIHKWVKTDCKPVHVVLGMITSKNPLDFVKPFLNDVASLTLIPVEGEEAGFKPDDLQDIIAPHTNCPVSTKSNVEEALKFISETHQEGGKTLICGSLYLAGHVLKVLET